jgi:hypothetical protein
VAVDFDRLTTDRMQWSTHSGIEDIAVFTIAFWLYWNKGGSSGFPYPISKTSEWDIFLNESNGRIALTAKGWDTTNGLWSFASTPTSQWAHVAFTYDTNDAACYFNGVSQSIIFETTPAGTWSFSNFSLNVGNLSGGSPPNNSCDSRMAEVGWWNRILAAGEISQLASGYTPDHLLRGLIFYAPMYGSRLGGNELDLVSGNVASEGGTPTKIDHPPKIKRRQHPFIPQQNVAGETFLIAPRELAPDTGRARTWKLTPDAA